MVDRLKLKLNELYDDQVSSGKELQELVTHTTYLWISLIIQSAKNLMQFDLKLDTNYGPQEERARREIWTVYQVGFPNSKIWSRYKGLKPIFPWNIKAKLESMQILSSYI